MINLAEGLLFDNRYELQRLVGRGGFAEVWLAKDTLSGIVEALKIYAPGGGMDKNGLKMFVQELNVVHDLRHSNLLTPNQIAQWERMPYLLMQYCPNGSCNQLIENITEEEAWNLLSQVASGLSYLHKKGIVHQDIKPDNILIDANGEYVITDFGISMKAQSTLRKSTMLQTSGGTMAYMAPERFSADNRPRPTNDIWSLGAMMYELFEGDVPFMAQMGGLALLNGAEIPNMQSNISDKMKQTILSMLSKDEQARPTAEMLAKGHRNEPKIREDYTTVLINPVPQEDNGVLTESNKKQLEKLQFPLNLDEETAHSIKEDVKAKSQNKSVVLGRVQQITLKSIKTAISNNQIDIITRLRPQLAAMIQRFTDEELQYTFYMLQSVLNPKECIQQYETNIEDCYWQTFWSSVAYRREGNVEESAKLFVDVEYKWSTSVHQKDALILATLNSILDGDLDTAHSMFDIIEGDHSRLLEDLIGTIYCILNKETMSEEVYREMMNNGWFYSEHLFSVNPVRRKEESKVAIAQKAEPKPKLIDIHPQTKKVESKKVAQKDNKNQQEVLLADLLVKCKDENGYLRKLDKKEIPEIKMQLQSQPEDNYMVQFLLGQLYLQENQSARNTLLAYYSIRLASEHGVQEAGAFMAYFYLYGKVVKEDLNEAEKRINIESNYTKIPFFVQLFIYPYKKQGNSMLAEVWENRLIKLNK